MLELLAPHVKRAVGVDVSPEMLAIARDRLLRANIQQCQVRLADIYRLPFPTARAARLRRRAVSSGAALSRRSAARRWPKRRACCAPGGRLLIADFAPHELEFLRDEFAHRRLGFSDREVQGWFAGAGLKPRRREAIAPRDGAGAKSSP